MKSFLIIFSFLFSSSLLAQSIELDKAHSSISFDIRHMMISTVNGRFNEFSGNIETESPDNLSQAKINFTVDVASIDTANTDRDNHLRADDFFDVEKHPTATFTSTKIESKSENQYQLVGNLTIKGVSKEVRFDVTYLGKGQDPWGNVKHGYEATTNLSRKEFGLTWNQALETGGVLIGDNVNLTVVVQVSEK